MFGKPLKKPDCITINCFLKKSCKYYLFLVLFCGLCLGALFTVSDSFVDSRTVPKWYAFYYGVSLLIISAILLRKIERGLFEKYRDFIFLIVVTCCLGQAIYGVLQYCGFLSAYNSFRVTGSFNNPAGFAACLCAGLPFVTCLSRDKRKWIKWYSFAAAIIIAVGIVFSFSRAGMISLVVMASAFLISRIKSRNRVWAMLVTVVLFLGVLAALYFAKKDSADGRMLIWRCSWDMIRDKPVFGHGPGGFAAQYMNYQAAYFETHPGSPYALLADNVQHPFNEYLLIVTQYGFFGLALLIVLGWVVLRAYRKRYAGNPTVQAAGFCLLSLLVFSFFSYPFSYPFTWVMAGLSIWIIFGTRPMINRVTRIAGILVAVAVMIWASVHIRYEWLWGKIERESTTGRTEIVLPQYEYLYDRWAENRFFLYNYAYELSNTGQYDKSLLVATECSRIWANYYLELMMAEDYRKTKQYPEAEQHFKTAAAMCPARFMPLYKLFKIYTETGETDKARIMAGRILAKEVKVPSPLVSAIQQEVQDWLEHPGTEE